MSQPALARLAASNPGKNSHDLKSTPSSAPAGGVATHAPDQILECTGWCLSRSVRGADPTSGMRVQADRPDATCTERTSPRYPLM